MLGNILRRMRMRRIDCGVCFLQIERLLSNYILNHYKVFIDKP